MTYYVLSVMLKSGYALPYHNLLVLGIQDVYMAEQGLGFLCVLIHILFI